MSRLFPQMIRRQTQEGAQRSFSSLGPHGFHRIAYTDWGHPSSARVVVCVHGLTRNARDFDWLARALQQECRVVCMDVAGRGESEWLEHKEDYTFRLYQSDTATLIARVTAPQAGGSMASWFMTSRALEKSTVDWVGTSMGGMLGMLLAAQPQSPIRRLVLNDVGPFISWGALVGINGSLAARSSYATFGEAEALLRQACAPWGPLSEEQWRHMARHSIRQTEDGGFAFACDPRIADATAWGFSPESRVGNRNLLGLELWSEWERIRCPVLVLRGKESEVLSAETVMRMQSSGPRTQVLELEDIGHAPALMAPEQTQAIRAFLLSAG